MLSRPFEAAGLLLAMLRDRPVDTWVTKAEWVNAFPQRLQPSEEVISETVELMLIEESAGEGCALCELDETAHGKADHTFQPLAEAVRLRPQQLAAALLAALAGDGLRASAPRGYATGKSFVADGRWVDVECTLVLHFGLDRPSPPAEASGRPILQINFRGADALPNPPAEAFAWLDLLDDQATRERAMAHIRKMSDVSYLDLAEIESGLGGTVQQSPREALGRFLERCGFQRVWTEPRKTYVDHATLSSNITRLFGKAEDEDLILECRCARGSGWHVHGRRHGGREAPFVLEPRLQQFVVGAAKASRSYRELSSRRDRIPDASGQIVQDAIALLSALVALSAAILGGDVSVALAHVLTAEQIRIGSAVLATMAALLILVPRLLRAVTSWQLLFLGWPNSPK